jgi:hypothetical protein
MVENKFPIGTFVRLMSLPDDLDQLPEESKAIFAHCLGKVFPIVGMEGELAILDVSKQVDGLFPGFEHDIRVEWSCLDKDRLDKD